MFDRLSQPERIVGASASISLVSTFLPWYRFDDNGHRVTVNAFGAGFLGDVVFFAAVTAIFLLLLRHEVVDLGRWRPDERLELVAGGVALGAVVLQLLIGVNGTGAFRSVTIGLVVALLGTTGMAVGGQLCRQERRPGRRLSGRLR